MEYDQSRFEEDNKSGAWRRRSILGERWWQHLRSIPAARVGALHPGSITPTSEKNPHQRKTHSGEKPISEKNPQIREKLLLHPTERAGGQLRMKPAPGKSQKVKPRQDREKVVVVNQRYSCYCSFYPFRFGVWRGEGGDTSPLNTAG